MKWSAGIVAAVALSLPAPDVHAQDRAEQLRRCDGTEKVEHVTRIAACSALIEASHETAQDRAVALFYRGLSHREAGDKDKAIADQNEAIRLDPQLPGPYLVRGRYHADRHDYDSAIKDFDEVLRLNPSSTTAFERRGDAYLAKSSFEAALRDFEAAIRLDSSRTGAYYGRRKAYEGLGQHEKAWQTDPISLAYGCGVSWQSRAYDKAMEYCNKALAIRPDYPGALWFRGVMLLTGGRREAAIADFDLLVKAGAAGVPLLWGQDSEMASVFGMRGLANLGLGRHEAAISDLSTALRLDAGSLLFLYARGLAHQRNGDAAGGAADLAAVTEDHAKIVQALADLGIK